jgi:hypothetical protein
LTYLYTKIMALARIIGKNKTDIQRAVPDIGLLKLTAHPQTSLYSGTEHKVVAKIWWLFLLSSRLKHRLLFVGCMELAEKFS